MRNQSSENEPQRYVDYYGYDGYSGHYSPDGWYGYDYFTWKYEYHYFPSEYEYHYFPSEYKYDYQTWKEKHLTPEFYYQLWLASNHSTDYPYYYHYVPGPISPKTVVQDIVGAVIGAGVGLGIFGFVAAMIKKFACKEGSNPQTNDVQLAVLSSVAIAGAHGGGDTAAYDAMAPEHDEETKTV